MKTKHLLFTAAMVSALAACTNDDFVSESSNAIRDDKGLLVELSENFAIAATKGDAETRAYDQNGNFVWVPNDVNKTDGSAKEPATLGLCWTGVNNTNPEYSALQTTDYRVFTNYKFEHQGWLYDGETLPKYDACESTTPTIKNGQFIPGLGNTAASWKNSGKASDNDLLIEPNATNDKFYSKTIVSGDFANTKLDFGAGFFKSKLGTIYQGEYIVYFPYSDEFYNGPVQAVSPKTISLTNLQGKTKVDGQVQHDLYTWDAMSKYAFSVGYTANMDGGVDAQSFTTNILSGGVVVRLTNSAEKGLEKPINTITLYSKNEQFILKQNLSAAAIKAANNKKAMYGENFYYGEPTETSKTIVATVTNVSGQGLAPAKDNYVDIVIPVLPTTVDDLTVLMTNVDNLTAEYKVAGTTTIKSVGQGWTVVEVDTKNLTFDKVYATDEASFRAATNNNGTSSCNKDLTKAKSKTVRVLGQIEISDPDKSAIAIRGGYTIVGEEGDALIIKGGNKTNLEGQSSVTNPRFIVNPTIHFDATTMNEPVLDCDVIVESAGCCNAVGGRLVIGQATVGENANIKVLGHEEGVVPTATPKHYTKDGWLSFDVEGKTSTVNGTIINEGQVTFGRCDRRAGKKAQTLLNGSITNKKGMTIFYAGNATSADDDAKLAVSSTGALNNEADGEFTIEGEFFFDGTGYNKGTIYDRVSSQVTGKLSQFNGNGGEYICDVNNPGKRFNDALLSVYKPTTVVRFVEKAEVYDFTNYANASETIKKYIVAVGGNNITYFKGTNITLPAVEVEEKNTLGFMSIKENTEKWTNLTVEGDLLVNGTIQTKGIGVTLNTKNTEAIKSITVKNNFTVNGKADLNNETVNVSKTWYVASEPATNSVVTGTTVTVGDATSKAGGLFDIEGVIHLGNNTDILVYGDINAGKDAVATILEATGSASNMPASVTYSGKNTYSDILTNWPKGGPSQMME